MEKHKAIKPDEPASQGDHIDKRRQNKKEQDKDIPDGAPIHSRFYNKRVHASSWPLVCVLLLFQIHAVACSITRGRQKQKGVI